MEPVEPRPADTCCVRCGKWPCECPKGPICRVPLCLVQLQEGNTSGLCTFHEKTELN